VSGTTAPRRYNTAKISSYECGVEASPRAQRGERIPVRYYTVAMTFIIFDIEIMFMIPWAVHFEELGVFGMFAMFLFLFNISVAYVYEWKRGGLDWD